MNISIFVITEFQCHVDIYISFYVLFDLFFDIIISVSMYPTSLYVDIATPSIIQYYDIESVFFIAIL